MYNLDIPRVNDIVGKNSLNIFNKMPANALLTDFAILTGAYIINKHRGLYWTKTMGDISSRVKYIDYYNISFDSLITDNNNATRLTLPYDIIKNTLKSKIIKNEYGVDTILLGNYPQTAVSKELQNALEELYRSNWLVPTENVYTVGKDTSQQIKKYPVYHYNNKRYIRVISCLNAPELGNVMLSNGIEYPDNHWVWVEIEPVNWLIDEESKLLISEKLLFSGVAFSYENYYGDFQKN